VKRFPESVGCPVELSLNLLGGKWKVVILAWLKEQPLRYAELRQRIPGLSDKVLTERLADLQRQGWIERRRDSHGTGQSRYQLTAKGQTLRPVLQQLYEWGAEQAVALNVRIRPNESNENTIGPARRSRLHQYLHR
jgi:DNA-binding HxlR family transcriptional regulator